MQLNQHNRSIVFLEPKVREPLAVDSILLTPCSEHPIRQRLGQKRDYAPICQLNEALDRHAEDKLQAEQ
jgi:hypothetical protein